MFINKEKRECEPFFSIVIPVYNTEKYLVDCFESILNQTMDDYEVVVVDDASKDSSALICDEYATRYEKFRAYHKANEGSLATRVFGMEKAIGKYIVLLDSDDMLRFDALEILYNTIFSFEPDLLQFNASRSSDFQTPWLDIKLMPNCFLDKSELYNLIFQGTLLNNVTLKCFRRGCSPSREELEEYFNVLNGEDLLQSMVLMTKAEKIIYIPENLYYYRNNPESVSRTFQETSYDSTRTIGRVLLEYATVWGEGNSEWLIKAQNRNLKSCVHDIKNIILNCSSRKKRKKLLRSIKNDDFFKVSCKHGRWFRLKFNDKVIVGFLKYGSVVLLDAFSRAFIPTLLKVREMLKNRNKNCGTEL